MKKKQKRITKADRLTAGVMQNYAHDATADLIRRRNILLFEETVIDQEILAIQSKLADAKARRERIGAMLLGIGLTIGKR